MEKIIENNYLETDLEEDFKVGKPYEDLTITDNFMFAKVMTNERLCKKFLELILHIKIERIQYYNDEQSLKKFNHSKGMNEIEIKENLASFDYSDDEIDIILGN